MAEEGLSLDKLFSNLLSNPELLSGVMSMAGKLTEGLSLFPKAEGTPAEDKAVSSNLPVPREGGRRSEMTRHKKLVEALMLYVGEEKRPKLELVLKILDIVELAEGLRG